MTLVKLETGGLVCPFPLIDAKKKMAELAVGDELLIAFDCTQDNGKYSKLGFRQ